MGTDTADALEIATKLCKHFEGFRSEPYQCPAGYWTIGYGSTYRPDGSRVQETDPPLSQDEAEAWLKRELEHNYMPGVLRTSPMLIGHTGALAAMTDFAYNLGVGRYRASTLRRRVEAEDWPGARSELRKWIYGGGRPLKGLIKRRAMEGDLLP